MEKDYNFYGCYLSSAQVWHCKMFDNIRDADKFALDKSKVTRLIPISKHRMHNLDYYQLKFDLICPLKIEQN